MIFCIADSFQSALRRLSAQEQKAVKETVFDLQMNPAAPGLQFHRIDKSKDPNFWSMRVSRDVSANRPQDPSQLSDLLRRPS
jgi:hypothetical protein